jgi:hypothetical protein
MAKKEDTPTKEKPAEKGTLLERIIARSTTEGTAILEKSILYAKKDVIPTLVPMINVALSGSIDGGLTSGFTVLAGPSKHFKTSFALLMISAYMKKYPEAVLIFYDTEFGSPQSYFESFGIDVARVVHVPIKNIEELKFEMMSQLDNMTRGEKVIMCVDSLGSSASIKELEDALNQKTVTDMTRAKALKSLTRMITPYFTIKDVPCLAICHTYQTQEMFSKAVVSGGTGITYSADNVWIIGRRTDKEGTEILGYHFVINIEKSRFVKEKSKIPIGVSWTGGIQRWSGLHEVAEEGGFVIPAMKEEKKDGKITMKVRKSYYVGYNPETQEILTEHTKECDMLRRGFWDVVFEKTNFKKYIEDKFSVGHVEMLREEPDAVIEDPTPEETKKEVREKAKSKAKK